MKIFKKAVVLLLCVAFIFTLAACHGKDEVAITSGKYEITSAMYSYYLTVADSEARNKVSESADTEAKDFSFLDQSIDGVKYEKYVKDLALEKCHRHVALQKICDELGVKLDDETTKNIKDNAAAMWAGNTYYLGESQIFQGNGVYYATYEKAMLNQSLYSELFESKYGKDGTEAVSAESIAAALTENYAAVYSLSIDYSGDEKPDTAKLKEELKTYQARLDKGEDFAKVKADFDAAQKAKTESGSSSTTSSSTSSTTTSSAASSAASSATSSAASSTTSSTTSSTASSTTSSAASSTTSSKDNEEKDAPKDANIKIFTSNEDTNVYSGVATYFERFSNIKNLKEGKTEIIDDGTNKVMYLVVKKNISADKYYLENLTDEILYLLKEDEYEKYLDDYTKKLTFDVSSFAIDRFKVKNISYGEE